MKQRDIKYSFKISSTDENIEITEKGIKVYDSKKVSFTIRVQDILAITPIKDTGICIYYITEKEPHPFAPNKITYNLEIPGTTAKLCNTLFEKFADRGIIQNHSIGLAYIRTDEELVGKFQNVSLNNNNGTLYITDLRVIHETENTISMNMYHEQIQYVKEVGKYTIRIIWEHDVTSLYDPIFSSDLIMPGHMEQEDGYLEITMGFGRLYDCDERFFGLSEQLTQSIVEDIFLSDEYNDDLDYYLSYKSRQESGHWCPEFTDKERDLFLACMLEGDYNAEWIGFLTDEEVQQRIFAVRFGRLFDDIIHDTGMDKHLCISTKHHKVDTRIKFHRRKIRQSDTDITRHINKIRAESLRYYDKRVTKIYSLWLKDTRVQEFTNEYDVAWFKYLLDQFNPYSCNDCGNRFRTHKTKKRDDQTIDLNASDQREYNVMKEILAIRHRNHTIITNFAAPNDIQQQDIYNNCWHDTKRKMWYVQNDNLNIILQSVADSNQDQSESTIGRRVWGFKEEQVEMFCGFPSIKHKNDNTTPIKITLSRVTGQAISRSSPETINYILPILKEADITLEMANKHNSIHYDTDALNYVIDSSGSVVMTTPKMAKFRNEIYGLADIPLNERIKRAVFVANVGLTFNPQVPLGAYKIQVSSRYPDKLYDECQVADMS